MISALPSNVFPNILLAVDNLVALLAFPVTAPVKFAVIIPDEKSPLASRLIIVFAVLLEVAPLINSDFFLNVRTTLPQPQRF